MPTLVTVNPAQLLPLLPLLKKSRIAVLEASFEKFGDFYVIKMPKMPPTYTISNPELMYEVLVRQPQKFQKDVIIYKNKEMGMARFLGDGLLVSDGEFWQKQRKLVAPALHHKRIEAYGETFVRFAAALLDQWDDGIELDISQQMLEITMRSVSKTLFNTEVEEDILTIHKAVQTGQDIVSNSFPLSSLLGGTPYTNEDAQQVVDTLDELVYRFIAEWREDGVDRGDLLSMLLLTRGDDGEAMSDRQVRDEILTLFIAGHETTANALSWTWYLLAQYPDEAAKLHHELDMVLQGRVPTVADVPNLPYTTMVVKESMRLYPPAWTMARTTLEEVELGDTVIPAKSQVVLLTYITHRDPQVFNDPQVFRPERFTPENEKQIPHGGYVPFGLGPRVCIGNGFAMLEATLTVATIASRYSLSLNVPAESIIAVPHVTLYPKDGIPMTAHRRD